MSRFNAQISVWVDWWIFGIGTIVDQDGLVVLGKATFLYQLFTVELVPYRF